MLSVLLSKIDLQIPKASTTEALHPLDRRKVVGTKAKREQHLGFQRGPPP